jgi:hypothetical protein
MRKLILLGALLSNAVMSKAQLTYSDASNKNDSIFLLEEGLYLNWYNHNFFKNNEYFLNTASGYTLFGTQHIPTLIYKPHRLVNIQVGAFLQKDFGTEGFREAKPYFLVSLSNNGYSLSFGNINASINHRLYDPILAYERLMTNHIEEGFSLKVDKEKIYSETWINWEKQQYPFANYNEAFYVGHNTKVNLLQHKNFGLNVPIQGVISHSGGQLDTTTNATVSIANAAIGLEGVLNLSEEKNKLQSISANANLLFYKDLDANSGLPYNDGKAYYANINFSGFNGFSAHLSYFTGNEYIAAKGDILYQATSSKPTDPGFVSKVRTMAALGLSYNKSLADICNLSVKAQPFYDITNARVDYFYGLQLTLQPNILLWKKK